MKYFVQLPDGFGAGCFGIIVMAIGLGLIVVGVWLA